MISTRTTLLVAMLGVISGCHSPLASEDHRAVGTISFEEFRVAIDLPNNRHKFRLDGSVSDLDEHMNKVIEEFGMTNSKVVFDSPSINGRTTSWKDSSGTSWAISYAILHPDPHVAKSLLTHEKYHALCRLFRRDHRQCIGPFNPWDSTSNGIVTMRRRALKWRR
jgi:hypothetical protein